MVFCLVYDDVGCPELLQIVTINDGKAEKKFFKNLSLGKKEFNSPVVPDKEVFVGFVAHVNPGEGEGSLKVHLDKVI